MSISKYWCLLVGEDHKQAQQFHEPTLKRIRAFAIAIHLPVLLWALSSYTIASQIFGMSMAGAGFAAASCSLFIYLIERLVLGTPSNGLVNWLRILLGLVIAFIGAALFDLVLFEKEVAQRLQSQSEQALILQHASKEKDLQERIGHKEALWLEAQHKAQCEADGKCSKQRGTGPIYQELKRHAEVLKKEHEQAQAELQAAKIHHGQQFANLQQARSAVKDAGLLMRIKALHDFAFSDTMTKVSYGLMFLLVLLIELMVVLVKMVYSGKTVDDRLQSMREQISENRAKSYMEAVTSPAAGAKRLLHQVY